MAESQCRKPSTGVKYSHCCFPIRRQKDQHQHTQNYCNLSMNNLTRSHNDESHDFNMEAFMRKTLFQQFNRSIKQI